MKTEPMQTSGPAASEMGQAESNRPERSPEPSPFHLTKILVPVDFSDRSKKALRYAVAFAKQFGAGITLLHVLPLTTLPGTEYEATDFPALQEKLRAEAAEKLNAFSRDEIGASTPVQTLVEVGAAPREVTDVAARLEIDLIVISTHGYTGLKHVLLGSVAESIVRHAKCPVLVVREKEHEFITA